MAKMKSISEMFEEGQSPTDTNEEEEEVVEEETPVPVETKEPEVTEDKKEDVKKEEPKIKIEPKSVEERVNENYAPKPQDETNIIEDVGTVITEGTKSAIRGTFNSDFWFNTMLGGGYDFVKNTNELIGADHVLNELNNVLNRFKFGSKYDLHINGLTNEEWDDEKGLFFTSEADPDSWRNRFLKGEWFTDQPENEWFRVARPLVTFAASMWSINKFVPGGMGAWNNFNGGLQAFQREVGKELVASRIAFPVDGKRSLEYLFEVLEDTPLESDIGTALHRLIEAGPDKPLLEQELGFLINTAFDATALQGFGAVALVTYKGIAKIKWAERNGASIEELENMADLTVKEVTKIVEGPNIEKSKLAIKKLKEMEKEAVKKLRKTTKGTTTIDLGKDIKPSQKLLNDAISFDQKDIAIGLQAVLDGTATNTHRVFNLAGIREMGFEKAIQYIAGVWTKKKLFKYSTTQYGSVPKRSIRKGGYFETKNVEAVEIAADKYAQKLRGGDHGFELQYAATITGKAPAELKKSLSKDYDNLFELESRLFAHRMLIREVSIDFMNKFDTTDFTNPAELLQLANSSQELSDILALWGGVKSTVGRSLAQFGIPLPQQYLTAKGKLKPLKDPKQIKARNAFLKAQLSEAGWTPEYAKFLQKHLMTIDDPILKARALEEGIQAGMDKALVKPLLELFRAQILGGTKVFETAIVNGAFETLYAPTADLIGSGLQAIIKAPFTKDKSDLLVATKALHRLNGTRKFWRHATINMLKVLRTERNVVDPMRTVLDKSGSEEVLVQGNAVTAPFFLMKHGATRWLGHLVNTFGQGWRLGLRGLGAIDETLKTINYNSWAYGEIMMTMPSRVKKASPEIRSLWVKNQMEKYFDEFGRGTNKEGIQYARERIFQESFKKGSVTARVDSLIRDSRVLEFFMPVRRTPANVVKAIFQRHEGFQVFRQSVRDKWFGTPEERAKILGDTVVAAGIFATGWDYLMEGRLTGGGPKDPVKRKIWEQNHEPYSLKIGDEWYPYNRWAPATGMMMMIADIYENTTEFDQNEENAGLLAITAIMQSLGNMHFIGDVYDFFKDVSTVEDRPELAMQKFVQPITRAGFVPKYLETGIHYATETEGFKEARGILETMQISVEAMKKGVGVSKWDTMRGDKYNWLTGELEQRAGEMNPYKDISGYAPRTIPQTEYDMVFDELVKMTDHLSTPQRYWGTFRGKDLGLHLTPEQFARYEQLMGTILVDTGHGPKNLIETLYLLMNDLWARGKPKNKKVYDYDSREKYPRKLMGTNVAGAKNKVTRVKNIITKFREKARGHLLKEDKGLAEVIRYRIKEIAKLKDQGVQFPPIMQSGYINSIGTDPSDNPTRLLSP